ncbi:hypothetical protein BCR33DRAFT_351729 [Rhizoclosmatium globosum]|uniref:BHLH domain-containing protein n=1 Tax=Rhizoclosmatium globosum TaxID=329046 RepID=A0A1Y2C243_9FUNG|nr:hypothetical protein BCR33DRAFT_351729 [Rhizoclosmatium globosum]|eukprot:ORY41026.1 hypothetical protein BCR33DRAFT_351729 [Rhizoclosmatium globosum]
MDQNYSQLCSATTVAETENAFKLSDLQLSADELEYFNSFADEILIPSHMPMECEALPYDQPESGSKNMQMSERITPSQILDLNSFCDKDNTRFSYVPSGLSPTPQEAMIEQCVAGLKNQDSKFTIGPYSAFLASCSSQTTLFEHQSVPPSEVLKPTVPCNSFSITSFDIAAVPSQTQDDSKTSIKGKKPRVNSKKKPSEKRRLYRKEAESRRRAILRAYFQKLKDLLPFYGKGAPKEKVLTIAREYIIELLQKEKEKTDIIHFLEHETEQLRIKLQNSLL